MEAPNAIEIPFLLQDTTQKRIIIADKGINIEKTRSFDSPVFIPAESITAFRYGSKWIRGYKFTVGKHYFIEIKDANRKIFKIKLKSYYGLQQETYGDLWAEIIDLLWDTYFKQILDNYLGLYQEKQPFELGGIKFLPEGISWSKNKEVRWKDIGLSNYVTYFMIYHKENPKEHISRSFAHDWNAVVLQQLLKKIVEDYN